MRSLFFAVLVFTVGSLSSCGSGVHADKVERVDSLLTVLKSNRKKLDEVDASPLLKAKKKAEEQLRFIQQNFPDTMNAELAGKMSDYKINRKLIKTIIDRSEGLGKEMDYTIGQLEDLKTDLKNEVHSEEDAEKYFQEEQNAAAKLIRDFNFLEEKYPVALEEHQKYKPVADSVVNELNRRGIR